MNKSKFLLSCDWGTSTFRLRYVEVATGIIKGEVTSLQGTAAMYAAFQQENHPESRKPESRIGFYKAYLSSQIELLAHKLASSLDGFPLLISGMASSSIGMQELPYAGVPFRLDGTGVHVCQMAAQAHFPHDTLLISGLKSEEDVMRGEETQLIGLSETFGLEDDICIFPGTHSKHVYVSHQQVTGFKTYMTGELFEAISLHTILKNSVEKPAEESFEMHSDVFAEGVRSAGKHANLLHSLFTVRTRDLFKKFNGRQNYYYLSGLLIGQELADLQHHPETAVLMCCGTSLLPFYAKAIESLSYAHRTRIISAQLIDAIVTQGQLKILQTFNSHM